MARTRSIALLVLVGATIAVASACGRDEFLLGPGSNGGTTPPTSASPTDTLATSPTPLASITPDPTRFPTPTATSTVDLTTGYDGGSVSLSQNATFNACAPVLLATGQTITLTSTAPAGFPNNDGKAHAYVLWQVQSFTLSSAGDPTPVPDVNGSGLWEITRVTSWDANVGHPSGGSHVLYRYLSDAVNRAQICHVPEYGTFNVNGGATVTAPVWTGSSGGLVAVIAGSMTVNNAAGSLVATGAGFRGGVPGDYAPHPNATAIDVLDTLVATSGGGKGESLDGRSLTHHGRGELTNGGGGGNEDCGGGGGGGNGAAGGLAGAGASNNAVTKGQGGAGVATADRAPVRLIMGGGGGGGATHHANSALGAGGAGGGVVLVFTGSLANGGSLIANGVAGSNNDSSNNGVDGAGGGGAGGTVVLYISGSNNYTGIAQAKGAAGGHAGNICGSGGGGGGGQVIYAEKPQKTGAKCQAQAGAAGPGGGGAHAGAAGTNGVVFPANCPQ